MENICCAIFESHAIAACTRVYCHLGFAHQLMCASPLLAVQNVSFVATAKYSHFPSNLYYFSFLVSVCVGNNWPPPNNEKFGQRLCVTEIFQLKNVHWFVSQIHSDNSITQFCQLSCEFAYGLCKWVHVIVKSVAAIVCCDESFRLLFRSRENGTGQDGQRKKMVFHC